MKESGISEQRPDEFIHGKTQLVARLFHLASLTHFPQWRVLLITEAIGRHVARSAGDGLLYAVAERVKGLAGKAIDDVDAHVVNATAMKGADSLAGLCRIVAAVNLPQLPVDKTLHPHAHTIHARLTQVLHQLWRHVVGVHLHCELLYRTHVDVLAQTVHQRAELCLGEHRRGAAAHIECGHWFATEFVDTQGALPHYCAHIVVGLLQVASRIEIAVVASLLAQRYVNVDASH